VRGCRDLISVIIMALGRTDARMIMKPGDRVLWVHSPRRSFLSGWRVQKIPGEIVRICSRCLRIRVFVGGKEKVVNVDPDNVILRENQP
jgi:hypothetical protein